MTPKPSLLPSTNGRYMREATTSRNNTRRPGRRRVRPNRTTCDVIRCRSDAAYTCQVSLLIILNARKCPTPRLVRHSTPQRVIEVDLPTASRLIPFQEFLDSIGTQSCLPIQPHFLDALEESLVGALRLLHANNISFPVSIGQIALLRPSSTSPDGTAPATLYLMYNKKATWASNTWPPTWKEDQLAGATLFFHIAKLLFRLSSLSSRPTPLDFPSQQVLATYLSEGPASHHIYLCSNAVAPLTAELTHAIALAFVVRNKAQECCDVLESFFGGPMPLPEPGTSPDTIYSSLELCARTCRVGDFGGSAGREEGSDEGMVEAISAATLTRLACCRAEAATVLDEPDAPQWWRTAMALYDAFLAGKPPISGLERICAFDLYRYRDT
ncbi:hypothetical protein SAMD00023353_11000060 [Rosellinia necatrix]|uniref:Uncharacterized protein n=1 Tax=Rosellinia necatrix TaxID=77044 RepID=A0A1W2TWX8_ROSNE|nr:hypothetical protein SAMD00023353_11000060 [Rosellinia necatrix]